MTAPFLRSWLGKCRLGKRSARRGMLLLVVLVIITVLAVIGASFSFRMSSQLTSVNSQQQEQQARWAAESGIDRVITLLRDKRNDLDQWYNNSRSFRRILVWAPDKIGGSESLADQEPIPGRPAWRFSIVSYKVEGDTAKIRYGITDEASKINLNTASRMQLLAFFDQLDLKEAADVTSEQLTDALIDWRDKDDIPISPNGAESSYYNTLDPPYKAKNKPLETVEELLMVKGFNGRILYGEDYNRNGFLDANEDDGPEGAFPPDNGDGILDRGILPYVTVYSWDWNLSNDNKRRVDMNLTDFSKLDKLPEQIQTEINPAILKFITDAKKRGYKFKSVGDLLDLQVYEDGSSNHDQAWKQFAHALHQAGKAQPTDDQADTQPSNETTGQAGDTSGKKNTDTQPSNSSKPPKKSNINNHKPISSPGTGKNTDSNPENDNGNANGNGNGTTNGKSKGTPLPNPVTAQDLPVLLDRLTTNSLPSMAGLINVNTASLIVLRTIPGLTQQDAEAIVAKREQLAGTDKSTTAWLVTGGALDPLTFALVSNQITSRSIQFTIDSIGFADHVGAYKRIQTVVEMRGQLSQIKYYRDISSLGIGYPVQDDQRREGFAFSD